MPYSDPDACSKRLERQMLTADSDISQDDDLVMEQILENLNNTPIGQVLKRIASLPEIKRDKVLSVRRQITEGRYDLGERLDVALDKAIEDLTG